MAEEEEGKKESFDFNSDGEAVDYISIDQARLVAIRHARNNPDFYGDRYSGIDMVSEPISAEDHEDYYDIKLSFRPAGRFRGEPGIEQFIIDKTGSIEVRQLLDEPTGMDDFPPRPPTAPAPSVTPAAPIPRPPSSSTPVSPTTTPASTLPPDRGSGEGQRSTVSQGPSKRRPPILPITAVALVPIAGAVIAVMFWMNRDNSDGTTGVVATQIPVPVATPTPVAALVAPATETPKPPVFPTATRTLSRPRPPSSISTPTRTAASTATPRPTATVAPAATRRPTRTTPPAVIPAPTITPVPSGTVSGTINYGVADLAPFSGHPRLVSNPNIRHAAVTLGESMVALQPDFSAGPMLATEWEISNDFTTWTWRVRSDVDFHKGYGNMTMEDIVYSYRNYAESDFHPRARFIADYWLAGNGGSQTLLDDYTIRLSMDSPWMPVRAFDFMRHLGSTSTSIVSKKQSDEIGPDAACKDIAATGPWEIEDHVSGTFWRFKAVDDHWRQTPHFEELMLWSIPEESARVAGFQTGQLDTFEMSFDSMPMVETVDGAKIVSWPNAGQAGLNIYGQTYGTDRNGDAYQGFDFDQAWVSSNPDPDSKEWRNAVKVKEAMAIAIDRDAIVDALLSGFGQPMYMRDWMGHAAKADPRWTFEFDPRKARQLLAEAGYPDGFLITMTPAIRGAPAETEACEAVAQYWDAIGIEVDFQRVPYSAIRPELVTRQYQGVTCHTVGSRLTPILGATSYLKRSTFSYGTEHPWMEEHITDAMSEVDPVKLAVKEREVYGWMYDNVMAFGLFSYDGIWPVGPRLDLDWEPFDFSEVRSPSGFEYIKHR